MPSEVFESIISDRISRILNKEFQIDSRAEKTTSKKRPDIICYHKGLLIGFGLSYDRVDAENDAAIRIKEHYADIVFAVWLKKLYPNVSEDKLEDLIRKSNFDIKVLTDMPESLLPFLEGVIKKSPSAEGWFVDASLSDFKDFIENAVDFLIKEEKVNELMDNVRNEINRFVQSLSSFDAKGEFEYRFANSPFWQGYREARVQCLTRIP